MRLRCSSKRWPLLLTSCFNDNSLHQALKRSKQQTSNMVRRSTRITTAPKKIVENGDSKALPKTVVKCEEIGQQQEQRRHDKRSKKNKRSASPPVINKEDVLPDRPIKKAAPARSRAQEKRSALAADLFGSDSSSDEESVVTISSSDDDNNANGKIHSARKTPARKKPLVEESTDLSSDEEEESEDEESDLAAFSDSDSEEEESEEEEQEQPQAKHQFINGWRTTNNGENDREEGDTTSDEKTSEEEAASEEEEDSDEEDIELPAGLADLPDATSGGVEVEEFEVKTLYFEAKPRFNERTLSTDVDLHVSKKHDADDCGYDRLLDSIRTKGGIIAEHTWEGGTYVTKNNGQCDAFYKASTKTAAGWQSGHRLSGEFVRCDQDNDVDKITATLNAQLAPLNIKVEMPPQGEVKMEFHFIKTPSFLPASTQWVVLGDMWAINDYQFMSERVAYLQDVQIQGKKTKSLWHVHQKYMSKQSIVEGPAKAMMSRLEDKKNCKVVVIKPTTKAN